MSAQSINGGGELFMVASLANVVPLRLCTLLLVTCACSQSGDVATNAEAGWARSSADDAARRAANDNAAPDTAIDEAGELGSGCAASALTIAWSPMYSAYDGTHAFQLLATVVGDVASAVTWNASDAKLVDFDVDSFTDGVLITTRGAGTVAITARTRGLCATSLLTITAATPELWALGSRRYDMGTAEREDSPDGTGVIDASVGAACTSCHGEPADSPYGTVLVTPVQTGGFSDAELLAIIRDATVPDGGLFDPVVISYEAWRGLHAFSMTDDEAKGLVVYLRSMKPALLGRGVSFGIDGAIGNLDARTIVPRDGADGGTAPASN